MDRRRSNTIHGEMEYFTDTSETFVCKLKKKKEKMSDVGFSAKERKEIFTSRRC